MNKRKIANKHKARPKHKKLGGKQWFLQETAQWRKDIFVCTGLSAKEITKKIKRFKPQKWIVAFCEKEEKAWQELIDAGCAFVAMESVHGSFIVRLREYTDSWDFWETLIHELGHLIDGMAEKQAFEKETEARAYLQEFLFHEIRRKLQGIEPKRTK